VALPPFPADFQLYLASQSPRRRGLLAALGVPYTVVPSSAEEAGSGPPAAVAEANARAKAAGAVLPAGARPGAFVLASDTVVVRDEAILGKPADRAEAERMLRSLSGREHEVVSGVALARLGAGHAECLSGHAVTRVGFRVLSGADRVAYLASDEWRDKAGAYGIQGLAALFIAGIQGEYANVVGLPVALVGDLFRRHGFDLLQRRPLTTSAG